MLLSSGLYILASIICKAILVVLFAGISATSSTSTSTSAARLPTSCPPIKSCGWGYGETYTIYEDYPNLGQYGSITGGHFEVSQIVDDGVAYHTDGNQIPVTTGKVKRGPRSRIYTVANYAGWGGRDGSTCALNFRIPCNSTAPFYHTGSAIVAARVLIRPQKLPPTWNSVRAGCSSLAGCPYLGTFGPGYKPGAWEEIHPDACHNVTNALYPFAFVYSISESVKESASLSFNFPLFSEASAAGPYVNWTCPYW